MSALASNAARGPTLTLRLVEAGDVTRDGAAPETDRALVIAARSGDRAAFARLYGRFAPMVHAVLLSRLDGADADDLTHEVFLKAMRRLDTLREPEAVGAWLAALARNRATTFVRWRGRLKKLLLTRAPVPVGRGAGLDAQDVLDAIRRLPEAYRETLAMRLIEQMTGPEIAARTGLSHGSVRVNLTRGMKMLREQLGGRDGPWTEERR